MYAKQHFSTLHSYSCRPGNCNNCLFISLELTTLKKLPLFWSAEFFNASTNSERSIVPAGIQNAKIFIIDTRANGSAFFIHFTIACAWTKLKLKCVRIALLIPAHFTSMYQYSSVRRMM